MLDFSLGDLVIGMWEQGNRPFYDTDKISFTRNPGTRPAGVFGVLEKWQIINKYLQEKPNRLVPARET